jgi:hypothetical protein
MPADQTVVTKPGGRLAGNNDRKLGIALLILYLIGIDFVRRGKSLKGPAKSNAGLYSYILFPFPKLSHWIFYTFDVTFGINHLSA